MFNWEGFIAGFLFLSFFTSLIVILVAFLIMIKSLFSKKFRPLLIILGISILIGIACGFAIPKAKADDLAIRYSVNAFGPPADVKGLSIARTFDHSFLQFRGETGLLIDSRVGNSTALLIGSVGVAPSVDHFFMSFHQGIGLISNPSNVYLSGNFQFVEDVAIGFRGNNQTALAFTYRHMSNAGIQQPNQGVDTIGLEVRLPQ